MEREDANIMMKMMRLITTCGWKHGRVEGEKWIGLNCNEPFQALAYLRM